ncbi:hypothetical protein [Sutcliffiella horikoshii]|uniref:hypothetical protein n=1 Tax=Sutcliffiella horikoshii TaxID=79883 RepID=UPI00384FFFE8
MNGNKGKLYSIFASVGVVTALLLTYFSFEESDTFKGFPVPKFVELTTSSATLEEYDWGPASEENGLHLRYKAVIRLWGWEVKEVMGSLTVYQKDGQEVDVISQNDYLSLSTFQE